MVEHQFSKLRAAVRFRYPALVKSNSTNSGVFYWRDSGIGREGVGKREFPAEEGSESSSVGKPWVSKGSDSEASAIPHTSTRKLAP